MKKILFALLVLTLFTQTDLFAQGCAMCKTTAENLNDDAARGLNNGILYLMSIPYLLVGVAGFLWYKKRKEAEESGEEFETE